MKYIIGIFILLILISGVIAVPQESFVYHKLNLEYNNGDLSLKSSEIEFLRNEVEKKSIGREVYVFDFEGNVIDLVKFKVPNKIWVDDISSGGEIALGGELELNQTFFSIWVPYHKNAEKIVIFDSDLNIEVEEDVSRYSKDSKKMNDISLTDENSEDKNVIIGIDYDADKNLIDYWWILLIIFILILLILFLKRKNFVTFK